MVTAGAVEADEEEDEEDDIDRENGAFPFLSFKLSPPPRGVNSVRGRKGTVDIDARLARDRYDREWSVPNEDVAVASKANIIKTAMVPARVVPRRILLIL